MSVAPLIGIAAPSMSEGRRALLTALGTVFGVAFQARSLGSETGLSAWIILDGTPETVRQARCSRLPCLFIVGAGDGTGAAATDRIDFGRHDAIPDVLRGRTVRDADVADASAVPGWLGQLASLATTNGACVWAADDRAGRHRYTTLATPECEQGAPLFTQFSSTRLARLLPLIAFLLEVKAAAGWEPPPLQASFMIDDPNLHWPTYGHLDFRVLAARAQDRRYHVAIATIPLDAWYVHEAARALFRAHSAQLSLLLHGNDHVANELARPRTGVSTDRLLAQALRRIARLERRTGFRVPRLMAPPHGACSESTIAGMARMGFEGVCVSRGSLRHHNAGAPWLTTIGMKPCDHIAGLAVIPRFGLMRQSSTDVLVAAVLRQPIVPMTHHGALADGYALFDDAADLINSLGQVAWRDMGLIARSLYHRRRTREDLEIRMLSTRIIVPVPEPTRLRVEGPMGDDAALWWRPRRAAEPWRRYQPDEDVAIAERTELEVTSSPGIASPHVPPALPVLTDLRPWGRRLLTEARDRSQPLMRRLFGPLRALVPGHS